MKPIAVARRYCLADTPHLLADEDGVVPASALAVVADTGRLVSEVRRRCAARLRASRRRHQDQLRQQRSACEAGVLARAAELSRALQAERLALSDTAADLVSQVARDALRRLMVQLPDAWPAQSSVQLALSEWSSLQLKDEAVLHVHPDDLPLLPPKDAQAPWTVAADPALARGACVLTHSAGTVHADFHTNLEALQAALNQLPADAAAPPASTLTSPDRKSVV